MSETGLTPDRILDAAEETLTRFGPAKTTVVDVARALGVSHGSVYRHFASKAALRDAVTERWLDRVSAPLEKIVAEDGPAARAPAALVRPADRDQAAEGTKVEPELFATYLAIFARIARGRAHPCRAPVRRRSPRSSPTALPAASSPTATRRQTGRAIFYATARFHDPAYARNGTIPASTPPSTTCGR